MVYLLENDFDNVGDGINKNGRIEFLDKGQLALWGQQGMWQVISSDKF